MASALRHLHAELSRLVGAEHVLEGAAASAAAYNEDQSHRRGLGGRADAVVLPGSAEEVAALLAWCYAHDVPLVARGGGTGLVGGAVPTEGGVVCSLERLRRVRELEPGLWEMHVDAGVSTRHVQRLARENGLYFAPDPGAAEQSQIGGNVATNAGGPHALKYGVTGSWVTGLEAALAPGELAALGGRARKDVAGYDLKSLLVGSEGTLGVITSVRLRLLPAPEAARSMVAFFQTRAEGCAAILELLGAGIQASALDFLDATTLELVGAGYPGALPPGDGQGSAGSGSRGAGPGGAGPGGAGFALIVEVDGTGAEVQSQGEALVGLLAPVALALEEPRDAAALWRWRDGFNGVVRAARGGKVSEDVAFPVERLQEGLERFEALAGEHGLRSCAWGHGGEGNVHATVLVDPASEAELDAADTAGEELFALVASLGGSIAAEHGVGWLKRGRLAEQWDARAVALHEEIKRAFDPKGLLNPGKKLAR